MGTEVLRPHDCLIRPDPCLFPRRKNNPANPKPRPLRKQSPPARKRREGSPNPSRAGSGGGGSRLVMGQVTILKRGESLDSGMERMKREAPDADLDAVFGTGRLGPEPAMIPKLADLRLAAGGRPDPYAGSAFEQSPSPRALPLPRFAVRPAAAVNSSATEDLRRLLRLS